MYYELYIDVFFLVNFMMDYLVLSLVKKMLKCSATHGSILVGALIGALCTSVIMALPIQNTFVKFILFHGVTGILMVKTGLRIRWNQTFLRAYILLYISTFLVGGVMGVLRQYLKTGSLFFALAFAGYWVSLGIWNLLTYFAERKVQRCDVYLYKDGQKYRTEAMVDTGNRLRDPMSGKAVSVISGRLGEKLGMEGIRYIPYHSVGQSDGVMPVMTLDRLCVCKESEIWIENPVVAVCDGDITADDYEMLMNPDLL